MRFGPPQKLAGKVDIGFGACAAVIVDERGKPVARRLRQADVARNHRVVHLVAEVRLQFVRHLLRQRAARVAFDEAREAGLRAG